MVAIRPRTSRIPVYLNPQIERPQHGESTAGQGLDPEAEFRIMTEVSNDDRLTRSPICPDWCCGHNDDPDEFDREGQVRHFNAVGGRTGLWKLLNVVSGEARRDEFAGYDVSVSEVERVDGHRLGDFVTLDVTAPHTQTGERTPVELRLTPGEARSLSAILSRAADLLEVWR